MDTDIKDLASVRMMEILEFYHYHLIQKERIVLTDINEVEFRLLFRLSTEPMVSMSTLGNMLMVSRSHMTKLVDSLSDAGLVERQTFPHDRRVIHISITEEGQKKVDNLKTLIQDQIRLLISNLQHTELEGICSSTETFLKIVSKSVNTPTQKKSSVNLSPSSKSDLSEPHTSLEEKPDVGPSISSRLSAYERINYV